MTPIRTLMTSAALAGALASPAFADLTADQVLADQLKQMQAYGLTAEVTGQSRSGDMLAVDGLSMMLDLPEGVLDMTMGGAFFREMGDGTVEITYPEEIPVKLSGTSPEGEDFEMEILLTQSGTRTVVSGIPEEIRYDFTSDSFALADLRFLAPEEATELDMEVDLTLTGLAGMMAITGGGTVRDYTAQYTVESLTGTISGAPDDEAGEFSVTVDGADFATEYEGSMAPKELTASLAEGIVAGNRMVGTASYGPLTYNIAGSGPQGSFESAIAIGSGTFDLRMDESGLDYGGQNSDMTVTVGGSTIPLPPLTFKMAEAGGRFAIPVVPSEDNQGFAMRLNLAGLEVDPMLWNMIDPAGQIPRDPATLVLDFAGDMVLSQDIFDPEAMETLDGPPGQVNALDINQILLTLAGAELTGDGAFTFDNAGGMPMPAGTVNLMLTGGNTLLDTLAGMGLLPEEQAMSARMMMGLFAQPGEGADTLVSTIEVQEDGAVLANGQRIK